MVITFWSDNSVSLIWQRAICLSTRTLAPWQSTDNDDNDDDDNDDAKNFRRRENFRKTRSGRRDRFRQKVVKIGAILAIFESCPAWNTRNVLLGTQQMSCLGQYRSQKYNIARNHGIMGLKKSSSKNDEF